MNKQITITVNVSGLVLPKLYDMLDEADKQWEGRIRKLHTGVYQLAITTDLSNDLYFRNLLHVI